MGTTALIEYDENVASNMQENTLNSDDADLSAAELVKKMSNGLSVKEYISKGIGTSVIDPKRELDSEAQFTQAILPTPKISTLPKRQYVSFSPLQEWEGYVIDIKNDQFTARLVDLTAGSEIAEEEADFPIEDLSSSDLRLLKLGAVFRWVIGYQNTKGGTKRRISQIVFRDLPQWTKSELESSREKASRYSESIAWD